MVVRVRETEEVAADALIVVEADEGGELRSRERLPFDRSPKSNIRH